MRTEERRRPGSRPGRHQIYRVFLSAAVRSEQCLILSSLYTDCQVGEGAEWGGEGKRGGGI